MESDERVLVLEQLMFLLSAEDNYTSKLYHYIDDMGLDPIECYIEEVDLTVLNKYEFGLLKRINFENMDIRVVIEEECNRRKSYGNRK